MPYFGPSRRYVGIPAYDPAQEAGAAGRVPTGGRVAGIDTSLVERDDRADAFDAEAAQTPGLYRDANTSEDPLTAALAPKRFSRFGRSYTYDPRSAAAYDQYVSRGKREDAIALQQASGDAQMADDDARVSRLVSAGYPQRDAARMVYGRAGATPDEESALIEQRGQVQLQRDQSLQELIKQRQMDAEQARGAVQQLLEQSRSGDRAADRQLRGAMGLLDSADRAHAAALRDRQRNALGLDLDSQGGGNDPVTAAGRARVSELDASDAALNTARRNVQVLGAVGQRGQTPPAGGGGVLSDDDLSQLITGGGGAPAPATAAPAAPPAAAAPATQEPAKKKASADMLKHAKEDPEYRAPLIARGYDLSGK